MLQGASNHFGADQSAAWNAIGERSTWRDDRRIVRYPTGKYVDDQFADKLIDYLRSPTADAKDRPFFAYLAFTGAHWPIQAPAEDIARYKGRYDAGYEVLREQRLARATRLGLIAPGTVAHPGELATPWSALSAGQKALEARKMEVYAAMVDRLDQNVGRVIAELKRSGRYDDTVIVFLADNGPEGTVVDGPFGAAPASKEYAALGIDNGVENIGRANSYVGYGPGWAEANAAPSRLVKAYTTEGGIRTTAFVVGKGVAAGRISAANLNVTDIGPTLLQLAGLAQPASFDGHPILPFEGRSLTALLAGEADAVRGPDDALGYELFYNRALRKGDWKLVFLHKPGEHGWQRVGDDRWRLYNIAKDPGETIDLAEQQPAKLQELLGDWATYVAKRGVIVPPLPAATARRAGASRIDTGGE